MAVAAGSTLLPPSGELEARSAWATAANGLVSMLDAPVRAPIPPVVAEVEVVLPSFRVVACVSRAESAAVRPVRARVVA
jgi:hypothetical protein